MRKKYYIFILFLFLTVLLSNLVVFASNSTEPKHIKERIATLGKAYMEIDMPEPALPPATLPQMKMERIHFDKKFVKELVAKYGVKPAAGYKWELDIGDPLNPDLEITFAEVNGKYGSTYYGDSSPKAPLDENNAAHVRANDVVRAFLDELKLEYEYPFSVVKDVEDVLEDKFPLIKVVPRFLLNDIPFHTSDGWTKDSDTSAEGTGDPTPMCVFTVTEEDGKIANIMIQNPVRLLKSKEDTRPILGWREALDKDKEHIMRLYQNTETPIERFVLKQVELLWMVDAHQIAYPAWVYSFDFDYPQQDSDYKEYLQFAYDARTGGRVW